MGGALGERSLYFGSPETVVRKMARAIKALGVGRFDLIYGNQPISTLWDSVARFLGVG
ncbi:hypothetical protein ACFV27_35295 [Streptomyces antimycoticus]|uniref:hypothetical protein n=1 Tax=Streptomyces antimycoticus TaxID=68175 RepID=UPI0036CF505C